MCIFHIPMATGESASVCTVWWNDSLTEHRMTESQKTKYWMTKPRTTEPWKTEPLKTKF